MTGSDALLSFGGLEPLKSAGALVAGAVRRRWLSIAVIVVVFTAIGAGAAALLPRSYSAETRLLVKKHYVMPALASPRRAVPLGSEAPMQSAVEFVFSQQSLRGIVDRTRLVERWDAERPTLLRWKDRVMEKVRGPVSDEDKADALVDLLAMRVKVLPQDDIIRFKASWPDPVTAVDVVNAALESFLDARRKIDVQTIADTYTILEGFTERARERVDEQLAVLVKARRPAAAPASSVRRTPRADAQVRAAEDDGLDDVRAAIRTATAAREALEKQHEAARANLQAKLADRRSVLTERHPEIQVLRRDLDRLSRVPDELVAAQEEERRLREDYAARGGREDRIDAVPTSHAVAERPAPRADAVEPRRAGPAARPAVSDVARARAVTSGAARVSDDIEQRRDDAYALLASGATDEVTERLALEDLLAEASSGGEENDDVANYGRALLKNSLDTYQDLRGRLANIQIELETAQAAFNYRYSVTSPARQPKDADSPNVPLAVGGAFFAGLVAGLVRAIFAELRAMALLSPSALARHLGLLQDTVTA